MTDFTLENPARGSASLALPDGSILVAWVGDVGGTSGVWTQSFSADGEALSGISSISGASTSTELPRLALLADGNVVVSWHQSDGAGPLTETKARIVGADGEPVTGIIAVNTTTTAMQLSPSIAALDNGGFVISFDSAQGNTTDHDGSGSGIRARIFDSNGVAVTPSDFIVNATTQGDQSENAVTAIEDGFVATYKSPDGDGTAGIRARIFDNSGTQIVAEFIVASSAGEENSAKVTAREGGGFLVTWSEYNAQTGEPDLRAMAYNASGTALWTAPATFGHAASSSYVSDVAQRADGSFAVIYVHTEDWASTSISGQIIGIDGQPVGDPIALVEPVEGEYVDLVSADRLADGTILISWNNSSTSSTTVKSFELGGTEVPDNQAPADLAISNDTILESFRTGATVGALSATDPEGDTITWSLVSGEGDNDKFALRTNSDGTVSVVLYSPLDHEASGGVYDLVVRATDSAGNATDRTIAITVEDDPFKLSSVPTGKTYTSIVENAPKGTDLGYFQQFDASFVPVSATLVDDANGAFAIAQRTVAGQTRYYLVTDKKLDFEALSEMQVTVEATDANGVTKQKTFDINVLDAIETGDTARGRITIDASTAMAAANGGLNWDTYIQTAFDQTGNAVPNFVGGGGWTPEDAASEYVFTNRLDGRILSLGGSDLVYNWADPVSGEDVHVVSGKIDTMTFGSGGSVQDGAWAFNKVELSITGLDLSNGVDLMARVDGEVNIMANAFMYGALNGASSWLEFVKATLGSYAQDFVGSNKNDRYTGTIFDDTASGGKGNDVLKGGAGDDIIDGGKGIDKLYGGAGADTFFFEKGDTGKTKATADTIFDFKPGQGDIIDLSDWDANSRKSGDQDFKFIGSDSFNGKAGELRFVKEKSDTWIMGDTNGDKKADFIIHLDDAMKLKADHFDL
ncbi:hypothetical protein [Rhizobium sp.]